MIDRAKLRSLTGLFGDFSAEITVERLRQFGWEPPTNLIHDPVGVKVADVPDEILEAIIRWNIELPDVSPERVANLKEVLGEK